MIDLALGVFEASVHFLGMKGPSAICRRRLSSRRSWNKSTADSQDTTIGSTSCRERLGNYRYYYRKMDQPEDEGRVGREHHGKQDDEWYLRTKMSPRNEWHRWSLGSKLLLCLFLMVGMISNESDSDFFSKMDGVSLHILIFTCIWVYTFEIPYFNPQSTMYAPGAAEK